jgi:uncharacterized protein with HEPN domain
MKGPKRSRQERLEDIIIWRDRVARHSRGISLEEFARREMTLDAVSRCIEVLGEAAARLLEDAPALQAKYPDLDLIAARAMRNRLSHAYFDIDPQVL